MWSFQDFLKLIGSLSVAIGGAAAIVIGLAKWFGELMAQRLLQGQRFRHESELEEIKSRYSEDLERIKARYSTELEHTKAELDKSKSLFLRYSEKQFELYNALWRVLWDLKKKADELWDFADPRELPNLSKKVAQAKDAININVLIIEEDHFEQLIRLITQFENFDFGKKQLVELRNKSAHQVQEIGVDEYMVRRVIQNNREVKRQYDELIDRLRRTFKQQIKG